MPVLKYFLFIMNLIMGRSFTLNFVLEANSVGFIQMFNMFNGVIITEQIWQGPMKRLISIWLWSYCVAL